MATSRHTYTRALQCSPTSVGLTQAHSNYILGIFHCILHWGRWTIIAFQQKYDPAFRNANKIAPLSLNL